jgi:hypothetical protein
MVLNKTKTSLLSVVDLWSIGTDDRSISGRGSRGLFFLILIRAARMVSNDDDLAYVFSLAVYCMHEAPSKRRHRC